MVFELSEYLSFYWVLYYHVREMKYPGTTWADNKLDHESPKLWVKEGIKTHGKLGYELFGSPEDYFYRVTTRFAPNKTFYTDVEKHENLIRAFNLLDCKISPAVIKKKNLATDKIPEAQHELFKAKLPQFKARYADVELSVQTSIEKIKIKINRRSGNLTIHADQKIFQETEPSSGDRVSEEGPKSKVQNDNIAQENFVKPSSSEEILDVRLLSLKESLLKIIKKYFECIEHKEYNKAFDFWHSDARMALYHDNESEFFRSVYYISHLKLAPENGWVSDNGSEINFDCDYHQIIDGFASDELRTIINYGPNIYSNEPVIIPTNGNFKPFLKCLEKIFAKAERQGIYLANESLRSLLDFTVFERMYSLAAYDQEKIQRIFPDRCSISIQRGAQFVFKKSDDNFFISEIRIKGTNWVKI